MWLESDFTVYETVVEGKKLDLHRSGMAIIEMFLTMFAAGWIETSLKSQKENSWSSKSQQMGLHVTKPHLLRNWGN